MCIRDRDTVCPFAARCDKQYVYWISVPIVMWVRWCFVLFSAIVWAYVSVIFFSTDMIDFKLCSKLEKKNCSINPPYATFGDNALSQIKAFLWHKHFHPHPTTILPDLGARDFFIFLKLQLWLKEHHFDEVQPETQDVLYAPTFENFQRHTESWKSAGKPDAVF